MRESTEHRRNKVQTSDLLVEHELVQQLRLFMHFWLGDDNSCANLIRPQQLPNGYIEGVRGFLQYPVGFVPRARTRLSKGQGSA